MGSTNCRDRPMMSSAQILPCSRVEVLAETLRQVRAESNVCVLSCLTNFLTASTGSTASASLRVEPTISDVLKVLAEVAPSQPDRVFLVAPPMYRMYPIWYREGLAEILQKFSDSFCQRPENVHLLPSFPTPSFDSDGVHLTPYSGMEFVLHLFDSSCGLLTKLRSQPEQVLLKNCESSRVLEDRMMALEQDHRRLNRVFETKYAADAELAEFHENVRYEDHILVTGLSRIPKMSPKDWQVQACRDVKGVLTILMGRDIKIVFVKNITGAAKDAVVRYQVRLESVAISSEIRNKFGKMFVGGDSRPPALKHVSISNRLTHETRVRITIMKILGQNYYESNPGSKVQLIRYESRPIIKITPPEGASDRRVKTFTYIDAVKFLPATFSPDDLEKITKEVGSKSEWKGKLRSLFVVISDDMLPSRYSRKSSKKTSGNHSSGRSQSTPAQASSPSGSTPSAELSPTSASRGSVKRGPPTPPQSSSGKHHKK